jgi:mannose/fructose-specific phosphotransferase system component IIA
VETAAHRVTALDNYRKLVLGPANAREASMAAPDAETPTLYSAAYNAAQLARFHERDPLRLADLLAPSVDAFLKAAAGRHDGERILTGTGLSMTIPTMTAALLGEQIVHGLDIARAAKVAWPISRADAQLVLGGVMVLLPDYLDRQRTAAPDAPYGPVSRQCSRSPVGNSGGSGSRSRGSAPARRRRSRRPAQAQPPERCGRHAR